MKLDALFQNPDVLPVAPRVVAELIDSFSNEAVSAKEIARKLAMDQVLSAKLLRLANSSYYQMSRRIGTVDEAALILGFVTVRSLVISSALVNSFKSVPALDLRQFWRYSLHTAVVAKWLATRTDENTNMAFTIGMMHAIGQLIIHAGMSGEAIALDQSIGPLEIGRIEAERAAFGFDFADVGAELARRWKFPDLFVQAIGTFPRPLHRQPLNRMAAIVHLAAWRARVGENELAGDQVRAIDSPVDVAAALGLDLYDVMDKMPTLIELGEGLEELVS